jgi:hypothetical protein
LIPGAFGVIASFTLASFIHPASALTGLPAHFMSLVFWAGELLIAAGILRASPMMARQGARG